MNAGSENDQKKPFNGGSSKDSIKNYVPGRILIEV